MIYTFVESLKMSYPYFMVRLGGGLLVFAGMLIMAWNVWKTFQMAREVKDSPVLAPAADMAHA